MERTEFAFLDVVRLILNGIANKNKLHVPIRNGLNSILIGTFEKMSIFAFAFPRLAYARQSANEGSENWLINRHQ